MGRALVEQSAHANPYKRRSQHRAREAGRIAGQRSNADDVAQMKRRAVPLAEAHLELANETDRRVR
jgi:hypothetical protein